MLANMPPHPPPTIDDTITFSLNSLHIAYFHLFRNCYHYSGRLHVESQENANKQAENDDKRGKKNCE